MITTKRIWYLRMLMENLLLYLTSDKVNFDIISKFEKNGLQFSDHLQMNDCHCGVA